MMTLVTTQNGQASSRNRFLLNVRATHMLNQLLCDQFSFGPDCWQAFNKSPDIIGKIMATVLDKLTGD